MDMHFKLPMHMPNPTMPKPATPAFLKFAMGEQAAAMATGRPRIENPTVSIYDQNPPPGISMDAWRAYITDLWTHQQEPAITTKGAMAPGQRNVELPSTTPDFISVGNWQQFRLQKAREQGITLPPPPPEQPTEPTPAQLAVFAAAGAVQNKQIRHNLPWLTEPKGPWFIEQILNRVRRIAAESGMNDSYGQLFQFAQALKTAMDKKDRAKAQAILEDALATSGQGAYDTLRQIAQIFGLYPTASGV